MSSSGAPLSTALLARVASIITARIGLHYPAARYSELSKRLAAAAEELSLAPDSFTASIVSNSLSSQQWDVLADHLTIGETYFFREMRTLEVLEAHVLPAVAQEAARLGRGVRIWSAGCCTGEEPYTLAIMLHRAGLWQPGSSILLATDLNPRFLEQARLGVYRQWSFRGAPNWLLTYFSRHGEASNGDGAESLASQVLQIRAEIRKMVRFEWLNLAAGNWPRDFVGNFDLIVCRNVLIYFDSTTIRLVAQRFADCLAPHGWLATAPAEAAHVMDLNILTPSRQRGALLFQRKEEVVGVSPHAALQVPAAAASLNVPATPLGDEDSLSGAGAMEATSPSGHAADAPLAWSAQAVEQAIEKNRLDMAIHMLKHTQAGDGLGGAWPSLVARLAERLADNDRLDEAAYWVQQGLGRASLDAQLHHLHGVICRAAGDAAGARQAWRKALYVEPDRYLTRYLLMMLEHEEGELQSVETHGRTLLSQLQAMPAEEQVPHGEGLSVARLRELVENALFM